MSSFDIQLAGLANFTEIDALLSRFLEKYQSASEFVGAKVFTLNKKQEFVQTLLDWLQPDNGAYEKWDATVIAKALQSLKTLSREKSGCQDVFSKQGSQLVLFHSGLTDRSTYSDTIVNVEGLKCLCNVMLQDLSCRDDIAKNMNPSSLCTALKSANNVSGVFLIARITFLCTATHRPLAKNLVEIGMPDALAEALNRSMDRTFPWTSADTWINSNTLNLEILKSLFNIALVLSENKLDTGKGILGTLVPSQAKLSDVSEEDHPLGVHFASTLTALRRFVMETPFSEIPLSSPITSAIHVLMSIPVSTLQTTWFPLEDYTFLDKLLDILSISFVKLFNKNPINNASKTDQAGHQSQGADIDGWYHLEVDGLPVDEALPPVLIMLKNIALGDDIARKRIATRLVPSKIDRSKPLRNTETITGILITFMTSVTMLQVRDCVSELLFVLLDSNRKIESLFLRSRRGFQTHQVVLFIILYDVVATKLIEYVGYGNAAGFLMGRGLMAPPPTDEDGGNSGEKINPVTGEFERPWKTNPFDGMTEEEMEREAEKLFVLMDRLNKTGIIKVETKSE